jgi:hypothetical protein
VQRQQTLQSRKRYSKKAFSRMRAGDSLKSGVYTGEGEASEVGASFPETSLGKQRKESRLCFVFSPAFTKQEGGFHLFSGFKLEIVRGPRCNK